MLEIWSFWESLVNQKINNIYLNANFVSLWKKIKIMTFSTVQKDKLSTGINNASFVSLNNFISHPYVTLHIWKLFTKAVYNDIIHLLSESDLIISMTYIY